MELTLKQLDRMLLDTHYQIPAVDDNMISKVRKELGLANKNLSHSEIMDKTQKKWKTLTRPVSYSHGFGVIFKNGF